LKYPAFLPILALAKPIVEAAMTLFGGQTQFLKFELPKSWSSAKATAASQEITKESVKINGKVVGCILRNVLSESECDHFIKSTEAKMQDMSMTMGPVRNMNRVVADSNDISEVIFSRIQPYLPDPLTVNEDSHSIHHDFGGLSHGEWRPYGLSSRWRFCAYGPGGHFSPHHDGEYRISVADKSLQTCQLYLNGGFGGGAINFVPEHVRLKSDSSGRYRSDDPEILLSIKPEAGLAVVFNQRVMHEGEPLDKDQKVKKYFMRSEVMFRNVQPSSEGQKKLSKNDKKAMSLVQEADKLESECRKAEAQKCLSEAFKISPAVKEHYMDKGQGKGYFAKQRRD